MNEELKERGRMASSLIYLMFHVSIECIKFIKNSKNAFVFINVISLRSNHRNVSATYLAIFRVMRIRVQIKLQRVEITSQLKVSISGRTLLQGFS